MIITSLTQTIFFEILNMVDLIQVSNIFIHNVKSDQDAEKMNVAVPTT